MPVKRSIGKDRNVNSLTGEKRVVSRTTDSSARKFVSRDSVQNNEQQTDSASNSSHIVDAGVSLKSTAIAAAASALLARKGLEAVRASIETLTNSPVKSRQQTVVPTRDSLMLFQESQIRDVETESLKNTTIKSESDRKAVENSVSSLVRESLASALPISKMSPILAGNGSSPEIDHVAIEIDSKKGVTDIFSARIVFDIPRRAIAEGKIKAIRIFKKELDNSAYFDRPPSLLSVSAVERLCAVALRTHAKNSDYISQFERVLADRSIANAITLLSPVDGILGKRRQVFSGDIQQNGLSDNHVSNQSVNADIKPFVKNPKDIGSIDTSVATDPKSLKNIRDIQGVPTKISNELVVGSMTVVADAFRMGNAQVRQNRTGFSKSMSGLVGHNNDGFVELALISPSKSNRIIGEMIEYSFVDPSVTFGRGYAYFVTTVDSEMIESNRSKIVEVNVDGLRIPASPKSLVVQNTANGLSLVVSSDDRLIEKFELYRFEKGVFPEAREISALGSAGFQVSREKRKALATGFVQIAEVKNDRNFGGVFIDKTAMPGHKYVYRAYAVDIFGNKSVEANEQTFFMADSRKRIDLVTPTISVEVDFLTGKARITFSCPDERIKHLFLTRRDVSIGQSAFIVPGQIEHIKLGGTDPIRSRSRADDVRMGSDVDRNLLWSGMFTNNPSQQTVFVDKSSAVEHTYQYQLVGMDVFGNKTSSAISPRVFISSAPVLDAPTSLTGAPIFSGKRFTGASITWEDKNVNFSAEQRVGNRETLSQNSVKKLFQVSRKSLDDDRWVDLPISEGSSFIDRLTDVKTISSGYLYKVQTFQSGGFISNFSEPVLIKTEALLDAPIEFRIRSLDTKVRPYFVALNWNDTNTSAVVDRWEVQRAAVNNFSAQRLNSSNPNDFADLEFSPFKTVYREASRFRERTADTVSTAVSASSASSILTGQHYFLDHDVVFGNSYFYRIRAVSSISQNVSQWAYRGIRVTDAVFERKQNSLLTDSEKSTLTMTQAPSRMKYDYISPIGSLMSTSGLIPKKRS